MSHSRAKQIAQKRKGKTKRSGNGTKLFHAKNKKMTKEPKFLVGSMSSGKKRRR